MCGCSSFNWFKGIEKIIELELSTDEKKQFKKSSESVDELVKKCKKLLV